MATALLKEHILRTGATYAHTAVWRWDLLFLGQLRERQMALMANTTTMVATPDLVFTAPWHLTAPFVHVFGQSNCWLSGHEIGAQCHDLLLLGAVDLNHKGFGKSMDCDNARNLEPGKHLLCLMTAFNVKGDDSNADERNCVGYARGELAEVYPQVRVRRLDGKVRLEMYSPDAMKPHGRLWEQLDRLAEGSEMFDAEKWRQGLRALDEDVKNEVPEDD